MGNGKQVLFWNDSWLLNKLIKERFLVLFTLAPFKEITVVEAIYALATNENWAVTPPQHNHLNPQVLKNKLQGVNISNEPNRIEWKWIPSKTFSIKYRDKLLLDGGVRPIFSKKI